MKRSTKPNVAAEYRKCNDSQAGLVILGYWFIACMRVSLYKQFIRGIGWEQCLIIIVIDLFIYSDKKGSTLLTDG